MAPGSGVVDEEGGECACDEDDRRQQHEGARHAPVVEQPEETREPKIRAFSARVESRWIPKESSMSESTALTRFWGEQCQSRIRRICVNG